MGTRQPEAAHAHRYLLQAGDRLWDGTEEMWEGFEDANVNAIEAGAREFEAAGDSLDRYLLGISEVCPALADYLWRSNLD